MAGRVTANVILGSPKILTFISTLPKGPEFINACLFYLSSNSYQVNVK